MKITLILFSGKNQKIQIQITNPQDPLVLYLLDISDIEFHQLKEEQCLLIDFQNFSSFFGKMMDNCQNDKNYVCILHKRNINEALLIFQERTQFKELNHLILNLMQANDNLLKKFLGNLSMQYKSKFLTTTENLEKLNADYENLQRENDELKEILNKEKNERQLEIDDIYNKKNQEINQIKQDNFNETKKKLAELEAIKNQKIDDLENKNAQLQSYIDELSQKLKSLEDLKLRLEMNHKGLEEKHAISNTELNVYKENVSTLREDNSKLNQKCFKQEKEITELRCKNETLTKQNEEKEKGNVNLNQLVDTLTKQRESYEDTIKSLKATNLKLEDKLQTSINEINKGNDIIEKLQIEIKNQKSKLKSTKAALTSQEQLTNQKQAVVDEQQRTLNDYKRDSETKDREITSLKNQLTTFSMKLNDNEKIIEENKQMIIYLNKNLNEANSNPFKSRMGGISGMNPMSNTMSGSPFVNMQNSMSSLSHKGGLGNTLTNQNTYQVNPYTNQPNLNSISGNNNNNMNISNNMTNSNNNLPSNNNFNNYEQPGNTANNYMSEQFGGSEYNNNNLQQSNFSGSNNSSGMLIMPETNFCNYKSGSKMAGNMDKYSNSNMGRGSNNLLNHKYGMMNSTVNSKNNNVEDFGGSGMKSIGEEDQKNYNFEEEFPRQMSKQYEMAINQQG